MAGTPLQLKAAGREIIRGKQQGTFLSLYVPLEHKNGYVFLLADIDKSGNQAPRVVALVREAVERLSRTLTERSHLQHRFEQVLQALNNDLRDLAKAHTSLQAEHLHMVIGVLRDDAFILSGAGTMRALFLRKTTKGTFRVYDLSHNLSSESGEQKLDAYFSTILDGSLQADDVLLLASRDLNRLLNVEEVHSLLSTLPPASALETIEQYLPARAQLALLLFQVKPEKDVLTGYGPTVSSSASMNALTGTERETTDLIGLEKPHVHQSFMKLVSRVRAGNPSAYKELAGDIGSRLWRITKIIGMYTLHILTNIGLSAVSLTRALMRRGSQRQRELKTVKSAWSRTISSGQKRFDHLPRTGKTALVAGVSILVIFIVIVFTARQRQLTRQDNQAFDTQLAQAEELITTAEASFIYQDEAAARRTLTEAASILDTLDLSKGDRAERAQYVRDLLTQGQDLVRHVLTPDITTIPVVNSIATTTNGELVIYADGNAGRIDGSALAATRIVRDPQFAPRLAAMYNDDIILTDSNGVLYRYRATEGAIQSVGINAAEQEFTQASDLFQYGERLYVLVPEQNQIYRHQLIEDQDYGPAAPWLTEGVDVQTATDIAVDGTIWVSEPQNLRNLDRGADVVLNLQSIDPPLGNVVDLWTDQELNLLFVLDTQEQRLLVLNKETTAVVAQYVDSQFTQGTELFVDIPSRNAYITLPTSILRFSLVDVL